MTTEKNEKDAFMLIADKYAENETDQILKNRDAGHARYLQERLFNKAKEEMLILTGEVSDEVYTHEYLIEAAIEFIKKDSSKKLNIIYQNDIDKENLLKKRFFSEIKKRADKEKLEDKLKIWEAKHTKDIVPFHFSVSDRKFFRLETDIEQRRAIANFGDKETAKKLAEIFDGIVQNNETKSIELKTWIESNT
ncbi:hypothetical protein MCHI_000733 [Candidatus Magnetoovum chiemensis]|nr:hypothetical protein MCHI_000733 [Candidatus Magnetoovum chiemensis]